MNNTSYPTTHLTQVLEGVFLEGNRQGYRAGYKDGVIDTLKRMKIK